MYAAMLTMLVGLATSVSGVVSDPTDTHDTTHQATAAVAPPNNPGASDDLNDPLTWAINDFAAHTGTHPTDVEVVLHQNLTWPDSSLGCPQPGHLYLPIQVPGYLIVLHADLYVATYHGAHNELPRRCETPNKPDHPPAE